MHKTDQRLNASTTQCMELFGGALLAFTAFAILVLGSVRLIQFFVSFVASMPNPPFVQGGL
jgi:hypothetical protein